MSRGPKFRITWVRDDRAHHEAHYRVQVFGRVACLFDVRISLAAKTQANPSPEEKIEEWFKYNPLPKAGALENIPDSHFSSQGECED